MQQVQKGSQGLGIFALDIALQPSSQTTYSVLGSIRPIQDCAYWKADNLYLLFEHWGLLLVRLSAPFFPFHSVQGMVTWRRPTATSIYLHSSCLR